MCECAREMVLNHVSLVEAPRREADAWLKDLANGIEEVIRSGAALAVLRMDREMYEIPCPIGRSLLDACIVLQRLGMREEAKYIMRLSTKVPLVQGGSLGPMGRLVSCKTPGCGEKQLSQADGAPLVLCAKTDGIAVGFPSDPVWGCDRMTVIFPDRHGRDDSKLVRTDIDQLTRPEHARVIIERRRAHLRTQCSDPGTVWQLRDQLFPSLLFGPEVEKHLKAVAGILPTVKNRLAELDDDACAWRDAGDAGGAAPVWTCKVTSESESTMNDPVLRKMRIFRSADGERRLFEWHARIGSGHRIHLRFAPRTRTIEIGYIGTKLPTKRFPK